MFRRDADAGVGDREEGAVAVDTPLHPHDAVLRRVLQRIDQQVRERGLDLAGRPIEPQRRVELQEHLARPRAGGQCIALQPREHAGHVDRVVRRLALGGLETRELQEVRNDRVHAPRLRPHVPDRALPGRVQRRIIGQRVEVTGNHRQRRAQFMRRIGDKVLARRLQAHLAGHVARQQQRLAGAVGHELQRQVLVELRRGPDHQWHRVVFPLQVLHELGRTDQVVDAQADVDGALEPEEPARRAVEPDDLALAGQDDDAVRQRGRGLAQLAEQLHELLFVIALAPVQPHDLRDDVAPDAANGRRLELRAATQPAVQAIQVRQLPAEVDAGRQQHPQPHGMDQQADAEPEDQDAREPHERECPHRRHGPDTCLKLRVHASRVENRYPAPRTVCTRRSRA